MKERRMSPFSTAGRTLAVVTIALAILLLGCGDDHGALGPSSAEADAIRALAITPGAVRIPLGANVAVTAIATDTTGAPVEVSSVTWESQNPAIAIVTASGVVHARGAGVTTVSARVGTKSSTATVTVTESGTPLPVPPPPSSATEPTFVSGVHTSLWHDDFESTANTAGIYARYATQSNETGLHLDATGGVGGSRALRIEWKAKSGCTDDSHFIEGSFPSAAREVVVQYSVRYTPNFVFDWIGRRGPCSGNAKKLMFLWAAQGSRFDFISENHFLGVGSDHDHPLFAQNVGAAVTPDALGDGNWHRITLHVRQSSSPTATDGFILGWIDGVQRWSVQNVASHASGGWVLFKLPTTLNQGSPVDQAEWLDDFRIWTP